MSEGWDASHLAQNLGFVISAAVAFLAGSIPFGLLIARLWKVGDLRARGSGNIGATNVSRVIGFWPAGFLTFVFDLLKGAVPVAIIASGLLRGLFAQWGWSPGVSGLADLTLFQLWAIGFCAVLGHCYSPWLHFSGGKGVATGLGVVLVLSPPAALAGAMVFVVMFKLKRIGSLASLAALGAVAGVFLILYPAEPYLGWGGLLVLLIALRHESNIDALLSGQEAAFK